MQEKADMQLGKLYLSCEKRPKKTWAMEVNGGWALVIMTFLIAPLFFGMILMLGVVNLIIMLGVDEKSLIGLPSISIAIGCLITIVLGLVWWYRRCLYKFGLQEIEAYERGVRIKGLRKTVVREYSEIKNLYFGTQSSLFGALININSALKPTAGGAAKQAINARLTVTFADKTIIRVYHCRTIYSPNEIQSWLERIAEARPDLFVK